MANFFFEGIILGTCAGIIGNVLVTSMYRWLDGRNKNLESIVFIISSIIFCLLIIILLVFSNAIEH